MKKMVGVKFSVLPAILLALAPAPGEEATSKPIVIPPVGYDVSAPLADIFASAPAEAPAGRRVIPLRHPPQPTPSPLSTPAEDLALQQTSLPLVSAKLALNFDGISADGGAPPDTNGSAGATQFVQIVNTEYAVYDKTTGALIVGPTAIHNIWSGFSGDCADGDGGDPVVLYDKADGRWVVGQINANDNAYCLAVSTTSDATHTYYRYEFRTPNGNLPDYPKLGVWSDAYYWTANIFSGNKFLGAMRCAFDRAKMLGGGAANAICFQQDPRVANLLPSDLDGSTQPPGAEPNLYLTFVAPSTLNIYKFHADFINPSNSTFTGPTAVPVNPFAEACEGGICIPQAGTGQKLDSLGDRLMYRNAYRNLSGTEYLVVNHSVNVGSGKSSYTGVRWYQIANPNGTPVVAQQGTFAPDSSYRWMGSTAMDKAGDIAVGYSVSSGTIHPAIRYAGRVPTDPANMLEAEATIFEGNGSQTGGLKRWGDYSSMSIDPVDDCTFWYTTEYIPSNGKFNWHTRIASFKFPGCQ